jgi:hypothetical protein
MKVIKFLPSEALKFMKDTFRKLKSKIFHLLAQKDFQKVIEQLEHYPLKSLIGPLFSFFYNKDDLIRWRAITAMGAVVSKLSDSDMESGRVVMRRLMWNLNDESGGIGWGSPEAMGEIMARHHRLAKEYQNILVSFLREDGNYIEYEMLQRGVLWGFGRLAHARPEMLYNSSFLLVPYMSASDSNLRGLSAWAVGPLDVALVRDSLEKLLEDHSIIKMFLNFELVDLKVSHIARKSLEGLL